MTTTYSGIKKKLMAATSMLLVASIMMMSSTYAWFTLSTAPEVTGISTTVGANGNLEIALSPTDGLADSITSAMGDGNLATTASNVTWGNLVDLSDESYGLGEITLMPAALNVADGVVGTNPLSIPAYGSDGRATELLSTTLLASYTDGAFDGSEYGVQAIGVSSSMSDLELAYRSALSGVSSAISSTKSSASAAIGGDRGDALAEIAVGIALDTKTEITDAEKVQLDEMIDLLGTTVGYIDTALTNMVLVELSAQDDMDYDTYSGLTSYVDALDMSTLTLESDYVVDLNDDAEGDGDTTITMSEEFETALTEYQALATAVTAAEGAMDGLADYNVSTVKTALAHLVDMSKITVMGVALTGDNYKNDIVTAVMNSGSTTISVEMGSGSGVLADIADLAGDYQSTVTVSSVTYGSLTMYNVAVKLATETTVSPVYLVDASDELGEVTTDAEASTALSETYGYALDFFFRTNAVDSSLLLQTEGTNRVYDDGGSSTQGGGSTMTFVSDSDDFGVNNITDLMGSLRVVFVDASSVVLGYAKLDMNQASYLSTLSSDGVTGEDYGVEAPLYLYADNTYTVIDEDSILTALDQNVAKMVSVIVYLDGNDVTNADVANTLTSMSGSLNLQFSSSADLVPMSNTTLQESELDYSALIDAYATTLNTELTTLHTNYTELNGEGSDYNDAIKVVEAYQTRVKEITYQAGLTDGTALAGNGTTTSILNEANTTPLGNVSTSTLESLYETIQKYTSDSISAEIDTTLVVVNAKIEAKAAITDKVNGLVEGDYTANSWAALTNAVNAYETAVDGCTTVSAVADVDTAAVTAAISGLAKDDS